MLRHFYKLLLRLHPRTFRDRFGGEMLQIYDDTSRRHDRAFLFFDAILSAFRQRLLRETGESAAPSLRLDTSQPAFAIIDNPPLSPLNLWQGCALAALAWAGLSILMMADSNQRTPKPEFAGVHHLVDTRMVRPGFSGASVAPEMASWPPQRTQSSIPAKPDMWSKMLSMLGINAAPDDVAEGRDLQRRLLIETPSRKHHALPSRPVLAPPAPGATNPSDRLFVLLDTDLDSRLSPAEIDRSPQALWSIDKNRDGKLTAEEYGSAAPGKSILKVLDLDSDAELSAWEINSAAATLQGLDHNRDGWLHRADIHGSR